MAALKETLCGDFNQIVSDLENAVMGGSVSATKEESVQYARDGVMCYFGIFERFSYAGGNRVSMSISLFGDDMQSDLCVVTSGGSTATFFKINTWGEETFLDTVWDCVQKYKIQ